MSRKKEPARDAYVEIDAITDVNQLRFLVKYFGEELADEVHNEDPDFPTTKEINRIMCYTLDMANAQWQDRLARSK